MKQKLILFHKRIERLKLNKDFFVSSRVNINYEKDRGTYTSFKGPDTKTVKAFLLDFRPFVLNDEPINFDHISNLVYKTSPDNKVKENTAKAKDGWNKLLERKKSSPVGGLRLQIDGKQLLSQENLDMWLNADYFHLDENKRDLMTRISSNPMGQISYFVFVDLLQRLSQMLFWFDNKVINPILGKHKSK